MPAENNAQITSAYADMVGDGLYGDVFVEMALYVLNGGVRVFHGNAL